VNLKEILMHLGNGLVARNYDPADGIMLRRLRAVHRGYDVGDPWDEDHRNGPYAAKDMGRNRLAGLELIVLLTEWLNANQDAREVLDSLDVEWPMATTHWRAGDRVVWRYEDVLYRGVVVNPTPESGKIVVQVRTRDGLDHPGEWPVLARFLCADSGE